MHIHIYIYIVMPKNLYTTPFSKQKCGNTFLICLLLLHSLSLEITCTIHVHSSLNPLTCQVPCAFVLA